MKRQLDIYREHKYSTVCNCNHSIFLLYIITVLAAEDKSSEMITPDVTPDHTKSDNVFHSAEDNDVTPNPTHNQAG